MGFLPWTPKVVPLGLGPLVKDPLEEYQDHIRSTFREPLRVTSPNPKP